MALQRNVSRPGSKRNYPKTDLLLRYDKETGTGGSNGATMRFAPEGDHGANAGLKAARDFLEPIKGMSLLVLALFKIFGLHRDLIEDL